jgi:hypothetical protein
MCGCADFYAPLPRDSGTAAGKFFSLYTLLPIETVPTETLFPQSDILEQHRLKMHFRSPL